MKKYVIFALCLTMLISSIGISAASAQTTTFTRYIQKGDSGNDVLALQKVLNSEEGTHIAEAGSGSPGFETDFFGEMTKQAVIKYQKKYALGSKYGFFTIYSGALDEKTRNFLNIKVAASETQTVANPDQQKLNELFRQSNPSLTNPFITSISPDSVTNGDTVTITGRNFSTSTPNTVRMTYNSTSITSTDGTTLKVKVDSALQDMFEDEADDLSSKEKDKVKDTIGSIPLFITVQNTKGVSNPYQIYMKMQ